MEPEQITLLVAFGAGLLSFVSPCVLPMVPLYLAHLAGSTVTSSGPTTGNTKLYVKSSAFRHTLLFVLGFTGVFVVLGVSVGLMGFLLRAYVPLLSKIAGVVLIILGLHVAGLLQIPFLLRERRLIGEIKPGKAGYLRSFMIGAAFSLGWVPCVGPILGGILSMAAVSATVAHGAFLLIVYSLGLALPFLLTGLAVDRAASMFRWLYPHSRTISWVSGGLLVFMGVLIFTNRLVVFNSYFDFFGLGAGI